MAETRSAPARWGLHLRWQKWHTPFRHGDLYHFVTLIVGHRTRSPPFTAETRITPQHIRYLDSGRDPATFTFVTPGSASHRRRPDINLTSTFTATPTAGNTFVL